MLPKIQQSTLISRITSGINNILTNYQSNNEENPIFKPLQEQDEDGILQITEQLNSVTEKSLNKLATQSSIISSAFDLDTNNDNIITPEEIESQLDTNSMASIFKKEDGTLDDAMILTLGIAGGISEEDLTNKLRDLDTNADGIISDDEINALKNSDKYLKYKQTFDNMKTNINDISNLINNFFENKK